jgi:hypothetical protein
LDGGVDKKITKFFIIVVRCRHSIVRGALVLGIQDVTGANAAAVIS